MHVAQAVWVPAVAWYVNGPQGEHDGLDVALQLPTMNWPALHWDTHAWQAVWAPAVGW